MNESIFPLIPVLNIDTSVSILLMVFAPVLDFIMTGFIRGQYLKRFRLFTPHSLRNAHWTYSAHAPGIKSLGKHIVYLHTDMLNMYMLMPVHMRWQTCASCHVG